MHATYGDVVLFNKNLKEEVLLVAHTAELINAHGNLQLQLNDGQGYSYHDANFKWMNYKHLIINDMIKSDGDLYISTLAYWTDASTDQAFRTRLLITNTLLGLFPVLSLFLIVALGCCPCTPSKTMDLLLAFYLHYPLLYLCNHYPTVAWISRYLGGFTRLAFRHLYHL